MHVTSSDCDFERNIDQLSKIELLLRLWNYQWHHDYEEQWEHQSPLPSSKEKKKKCYLA